MSATAGPCATSAASSALDHQPGIQWPHGRLDPRETQVATLPAPTAASDSIYLGAIDPRAASTTRGSRGGQPVGMARLRQSRQDAHRLLRPRTADRPKPDRTRPPARALRRSGTPRAGLPSSYGVRQPGPAGRPFEARPRKQHPTQQVAHRRRPGACRDDRLNPFPQVWCWTHFREQAQALLPCARPGRPGWEPP